MYINNLSITNIRSIERFDMSFPSGKQAGWHVLIGDNGSGKSTIVRSLALCLIGPSEARALRQDFNNWLRGQIQEGNIQLEIQRDLEDRYSGLDDPSETLEVSISVKRDENSGLFHNLQPSQTPDFADSFWDATKGWFSAGFGPFRRFTGGDKDWEKVYKSAPRAAAHLSVFSEDVALTEAIEWLRELYFKVLEKKSINSNSISDEKILLDYLKDFLNHSNLLPHNIKFDKVTFDGVLFIDGNGFEIDVTQLSDGFRSLLSLTFELLRQLIRFYGQENVFSTFNEGKYIINLPGIVLVDEVDAHLHPTWQTRIGQWFTKVFPNIQFIVTTHSPLVCRASEKGSIWRLAPPGSDLPSGEVTGIEKDKLIFGNVLEAYGTEVFGKEITRSEEANHKLDRLAELNNKLTFGGISHLERKELENLRKVLTTDDTTEY